MPTSGTPDPHEPVPPWRATLQRILTLAWRSDVPMRLADEALAQNVRFEFERAASPLFGYRSSSGRIREEDGTTLFRVVLIAPNGNVVLRDAPTDAEALGRTLTEHLARNRR